MHASSHALSDSVNDAIARTIAFIQNGSLLVSAVSSRPPPAVQAMWESLTRIFDPTGFPPRWHCCTAWSDEPWLGWLHIVSYLATFAAYYAVPCVVICFVSRRRNLKFPPVFYLFLCLVFLSCGTVPLIESVIFWWPVYRFPVKGRRPIARPSSSPNFRSAT